MDLNEFKDYLSRIKAGAKDAYGEGREDYSQAYYEARDLKKKGINATRISHMLGTNPTFVRARELLGLANNEDVEVRRQMGLGLNKDRATKIGQVLGTIGNDLTQDHTRSAWWLLNAPQAAANVINEEALNAVNPELFKAEEIQTADGKYAQEISFDSNGEPVKNRAFQNAIDNNLIDKETGRKRKGVGAKNGYYTRRKYAPGDVAALGIPTGIAINAGIGLLNPLGGSGGYEAVIPNAQDKTRTDNVLLEIGTKYILGRTGGMLPYNEFKKHRPDVAKGEYNAYKAFKYDKNLDLNITDGDFTLPTGVLKGTTDGIHGAELQFLGRSLPLNTTGVPFVSALIGGAIGARRGSKRPIKHGFIGGMSGLAAGGGAGLLLENERQRRNGISNFGNTVALDPEETQVGF